MWYITALEGVLKKKGMLSKIFVSFFLIIFSTSLWAQTSGDKFKVVDDARIKCTYLLEYQRDSTNKESINLEDMILFIGDSVSLFQSMNSYLKDSIMRSVQFINASVALAQLSGYRTSFAYQLFKNYPRKEMSFVDRIPPHDYFLIEQPMNLFNWKTGKDTATISGYHCQKATTHFAGRDYIAWFTTEIPLSEGPYKFNGLPGLIIKISDTRRQYIFKLTSLERVKKGIRIEFPERNYIRTTQKKFDKAYRDFVENFSERLSRMGISLNLSDKDIKKRLSRNNNAIEIRH